jgi:hypothetical protein
VPSNNQAADVITDLVLWMMGFVLVASILACLDNDRHGFYAFSNPKSIAYSDALRSVRENLNA